MLADLAELALGQVRANLRRSLLALLGVALGVAVLASLSDLGRAARLKTTADLSRLGLADVVRVELLGGMRLVDPELAARLPGEAGDAVRLASPEAHREGVAVRLGGLERPAGVFGVEPAYAEMMNLRPRRGRFLDAEDAGRPVAVLGEALARELGATDRVVMFGQVFRVVGVLERNPWAPADRAVFVPFSTALGRGQGAAWPRRLVVKMSSLNHLEEGLSAVTAFFARRGFRPEAVRLAWNHQAAAQVRRTVRLLEIFLWLMGGTTLLLGGLGIGNTLLASAAERTREIGVRKAVGAGPAHVLGQFLMEALFLSLLGAAAGVILGLALVAGVGRFMPEAQVSLDALTALLCAGGAVLAGVGFSLYPVLRASRLDVVQALRGA